MKIEKEVKVTISLSAEEVKDILIDAIPKRFTGWMFFVNLNPDGSAVLDATPPAK